MITTYDFIGVLENFTESPLWSYHIKIPDTIATYLREGKNTRTLTTLNDIRTIHCALMPDGKGGSFIMLNKELRSELNLSLGDEIQINIKIDNSKYGMEMPEEFSELLDLDEDGSRLFHKLTMGKQRSLIHITAKPKQSNTRINKALIILDYLKHTGGNLDFKELNIAFKNSSR